MPSGAPVSRSDLAVVRQAVPADRCAAWLGLVERAIQQPVPDAAPSLRVNDVDGLDVAEVWSALASPVRDRCAAALQAPVAIDVDQCWVRHQPAATAGHGAPRPHSWHQDGALGFDFLGHGLAAPPSDALLRMVTCWIALTPCGIESAGLELVVGSLDQMLSPAELRDEVVGARWPAVQRHRPVMASGDAAVFTGDVLHRTHITPRMSRGRISLELRCFAADAVPARLRDDRFITVDEITPASGRRCPPSRRCISPASSDGAPER